VSLDRDGLIEAITAFLAGRDANTLSGIRDALGRELDQAGPGALADLNERLAAACDEWSCYPRDPLARRIHHVLADRLLERGSTASGLEHLARVADDPVVIFANHLSYSDANLLEILLYRAGAVGLCDRLTVMAGPKVYSSLKRRFSSLCFTSIRTPQNSSVSSEDAVMNAREVARAARRVIEIAHERLARGDALLVFGEGTRSRTREMQPMLAAVARYVESPATWVLPVGITGTEALFPVGEETLHAVRITANVGPPIATAALRERAHRERRLMMDVVGLAIARLLLPEYRGAYGENAADLDRARRVLREIAEGE